MGVRSVLKETPIQTQYFILIISIRMVFLFCTRYGIRIRVAGMKILSPRPLDEPSVYYLYLLRQLHFPEAF